MYFWAKHVSTMPDFMHADKENFSEDDLHLDEKIRPQNFQDFAGQRKALDNLEVFVAAARKRKKNLDHVLLHGPPGLGKTTLAHIISREMGVSCKLTSGPVLDKPGNLAGILTNLEPNDILFIDEIHRLSPVVEEYLYSAMEDFCIDIMLETGPNARSVQIGLNPFTLVGATTRSGMLTKPLLARFGIQLRLEYYTTDLLGIILQRSARVMNIPMTEEASLEIARRSRGTPRIANALLRRVRDFAEIKGNGKIDIEITRFALDSLYVDEFGLDEMDNKILRTMVDIFGGRPVGISSLATSIGENPETLEEVYEPYLIQEGFIIRTPRGRELTDRAYKHLGIQRKQQNASLF